MKFHFPPPDATVKYTFTFAPMLLLVCVCVGVRVHVSVGVMQTSLCLCLCMTTCTVTRTSTFALPIFFCTLESIYTWMGTFAIDGQVAKTEMVDYRLSSADQRKQLPFSANKEAIFS